MLIKKRNVSIAVLWGTAVKMKSVFSEIRSKESSSAGYRKLLREGWEDSVDGHPRIFCEVRAVTSIFG